MTFSEEVLAVVRKAVEKHPEDIQKEIRFAENAIRKLSSFEELVADLVRSAVEQLVYDARHQFNVAMKRSTNGYGGPAKVKTGDSKSVNEVARSVYHYHIAGTVLGNLKGEELVDLAKTERALADGHSLNARLCEALVAIVPDGKRVRDAVSEKKLEAIFRQVQEKLDKDAA